MVHIIMRQSNAVFVRNVKMLNVCQVKSSVPVANKISAGVVSTFRLFSSLLTPYVLHEYYNKLSRRVKRGWWRLTFRNSGINWLCETILWNRHPYSGHYKRPEMGWGICAVANGLSPKAWPWPDSFDLVWHGIFRQCVVLSQWWWLWWTKRRVSE